MSPLLFINYRRMKKAHLDIRSFHFDLNSAVSLLKLSFIGFVFLGFLSGIGLLIYRNIVVAQFSPYLQDQTHMLAFNSDSLVFLDRNKQEIHKTSGRYVARIVPLKELPKDLVNATLAAEDKDFYKHPGFSWRGVVRAVYKNGKNFDLYYQGGSTITQQLTRNILLTNDKSVIRKLKEAILALEIERHFSKDQILEYYLSSSYYGSGVYGVEGAAKVYFDKKLKDLTLAESALIASLPAAPSILSPTNGDREKMVARQRYVLDQMAKVGHSSQEEIEEAKKQELKFAKYTPKSIEAAHFIFHIKNQLKELFPEQDLDRSGYKIYTTLDLKMQRRAQKQVSRNVASLSYRNVHNGALLSTNPKTGEILAMVGSVNFYQPGWGAVNVLTRYRSPGSSIKPLIYASALENKSITAGTVLEDEPVVYKNDWETYKPENWDRKFMGSMLPRKALIYSRNIPAVEVAAKTGVSRVLGTIKKLGIDGLGEPSDYGLSIAIGGLEVRGIDLATSYSVLANGGELIRPFGIVKVEDKFGKVLYEAQPEKEEVMDPRIAYVITNLLGDSPTRRNAWGYRNPLDIGRPSAVKTGTSEDFKNAWTVGYTPSLLTLVWVGNNDSSPMINIWGVESAAVVWGQFMRETLAVVPIERFDVPSGIKTASICTLDGSLAAPGQPSTSEIFLAGSQPTKEGICEFIAEREEEERLREQRRARLAERLEEEEEEEEEDPGNGGPDDPGFPFEEEED